MQPVSYSNGWLQGAPKLRKLVEGFRQARQNASKWGKLGKVRQRVRRHSASWAKYVNVSAGIPPVGQGAAMLASSFALSGCFAPLLRAHAVILPLAEALCFLRVWV